MRNRLIQNFTFDEEIRKDLIFSDTSKIRLNSDNEVRSGIQLVRALDGTFPTDDDLFIETPFVEPHALINWLSFEFIFEFKVQFPTQRVLPDGTVVQFKIKTTTGNFFWDGGAWVTAGLSDWNSEADIRDNISTLPIATIGNKKIALVVNLKSTDGVNTPFVSELKLLGDFEVEYFQDLVYDTVIGLLNDNFRTSSNVGFVTDSSISSIDLASMLGKESGYNVFGIKRVLNLTDDPQKLNDLFDSYTFGAGRQDGFTFDPGIVSFNTSIPANKRILIEFNYLPEIMVKTGQDFFEINTYPSLVFTRINEVSRPGFILQDVNSLGEDFIRLNASIVARQFSPQQKSYRFTYDAYTNRQTDQMRLMKDLNAFLSNNRALIMWGLGNKVDLDIVDSLDTVGNSQVNDQSDTNKARGIFDVLGLLFYEKVTDDIPLVLNTNVTMTPG